MKNPFRQIVGFMLVSPFGLMVSVFALFIGRQSAIKFWGPSLTLLAKRAVNFTVPKIESASEFDLFKSKLLANLESWKPLFDVSIAHQDKNTLKLHMTNCPFCEVSNHLGLSEFGPYICQGDWEVAKDNADKWDFERQHQIGTGDSFCDHTYKRKQSFVSGL